MKPTIFIPLEYAADLEVDPSHLSHCNAGRRKLSLESAIKLMGILAAQGKDRDPRMVGITLEDFRPEVRLLWGLPGFLLGPSFLALWKKPKPARGGHGR